MGFLKLLLVVFFPILLLPQLSSAQNGSWNPAGANTDFPRTLTTLAELPMVRARLAEPNRLTLFNQITTDAFIALPAGNTSVSERRARARMAKNAAFVLLVNRQSGTSVNQPLSISQQEALKAKVKTSLRTINTNVESVFQYTEWQWRSKELIDYLIAYDLLRGAGVPADSLLQEKAQLQLFTNKLYSAANYLGGAFFSNTKNNHNLMTSAALGMAAVVLNDAGGTAAADKPQNWINAGMFNIDNVLWRDAKRQSEPGVLAGYAEGPYYFRYAFLNCLPFFRAMGHFLPDTAYSYTWNGQTRTIHNPYYDNNYDLLYQWISDITMPDGRFPALEDSFTDMGIPELALAGKSQFVRPLWLNNLATNQSNSLSKQLTHNVDMRAAWLAALTDPTPAIPTNFGHPVSGNLVFRSGNGHLANYFHLYGKQGAMLNNSGGHNQADAASFSLYSKGQLLALDPGYLSYNLRTELGNATNHNMILVDGSGPAIGTTGSANETEAFVQNFFADNSLAYGEVATAYNGASITRKAISVRGDYYLLSDFISSGQSHEYTWQLHGYGLESGTDPTGIFTADFANNSGQWVKNGVGLFAHVTASGGQPMYNTRASYHELTYETRQNHSVMEVKQTAPTTEFLSVLQPFTSQPKEVTTLQLQGAVGALVHSGNNNFDVILAKADTNIIQFQVPEQNLPVSSDAMLTFVAIDSVGTATQWLLQEGKNLAIGGKTVVTSSERVNISWTQISENKITAYVNKPTILQIRTTFVPDHISGAGMAGWSYENGILTASFSQSGPIAIQYTFNPLPVKLLSFTTKLSGNEVQLNWKTITESENQGYQVQVSTDGKNFKDLAWVPANKPNSTLSYSYSLTDDVSGITGLRYYKLLQYDLDGNIHNLGTRVVNSGNTETEVSIQTYPNPFSGSFICQLHGAANEKVRIEIADFTGKVLYGQDIRIEQEKTLFTITPQQPFPKGILFLSVTSSACKLSQKLVSF